MFLFLRHIYYTLTEFSSFIAELLNMYEYRVQAFNKPMCMCTLYVVKGLYACVVFGYCGESEESCGSPLLNSFSWISGLV